MRYIFVYRDFVKPVEQLLADLGVSDVEIVPVAKGERTVPATVLGRVSAGGGVCATVNVERSYVRSLAAVDVQHSAKSFRADDKVLGGWLCPTPPIEQVPRRPSESFAEARQGCGWLVFADKALERADEIASLRWHFVEKAAALLRRWALGDEIGDLRNLRNSHQVDYAPNGQVYHRYHAPGHPHPHAVCAHFTEGKKTSPEGAARIYFDWRPIEGVRHILVLYVGPHPPDGTHDATFHKTEWQPLAPHEREERKVALGEPRPSLGD